MARRFYTTEYNPTEQGGTAIFRGNLRRVRFGNPHEQDINTLYRMASVALRVPLSEVRARSITFDSPSIGHHTVTLNRNYR